MQDLEFGRRLIESLADVPNHRSVPASLDDEALANLYIWVARQYPHRDDPDTRGAHFVGTREAISRWRDSILQYLKERGTDQSLIAIEKICRKLPELEWMRWVLNEARETRRRRSWTPLQPNELIALSIEQLRQPPLTQASSGYTDIDARITELVKSVRLSIPNINAEHLSDFVDLLSAIANYLRISLEQRLYKEGVDVSEAQFQHNLLYHLRTRLGEGVKEAPKQGGGPTDIQYRSITAELKVEKKISDRRKMLEKYLSQPTQYASADGAQLGILCVLDLTPKDQPPANLQNQITIETPQVHGFPNHTAPFPTKLAAIVIDGNLRLPSSYSH